MRRFNGIGDKIVSPAKVAGLASWTLALWIDYDGTAANQWQHPIGLGTGHDATVYVIEATGQLAMKTTDSAGNAAGGFGYNLPTGTGDPGAPEVVDSRGAGQFGGTSSGPSVRIVVPSDSSHLRLNRLTVITAPGFLKSGRSF